MALADQQNQYFNNNSSTYVVPTLRERLFIDSKTTYSSKNHIFFVRYYYYYYYTCKEALDINKLPSAEISTLWSCWSGMPFFSQDILGAGAALGGEQRNDAAEPASTDVDAGDIANCFLRSVKRDLIVLVDFE